MRPRPEPRPRLLQLLGVNQPRPQLVLLDHGIYISLPDPLRRLYCQVAGRGLPVGWALGAVATADLNRRQLRMAGLLSAACPARPRACVTLGPLQLWSAIVLGDMATARQARCARWSAGAGPALCRASLPPLCTLPPPGVRATHPTASHSIPAPCLRPPESRQPPSWLASGRAASCLSCCDPGTGESCRRRSAGG